MCYSLILEFNFKEYEEFTAQTKAEKLKSKQQTDQLKKELQMKHVCERNQNMKPHPLYFVYLMKSTEILELNQRFKDLHGKYESVKVIISVCQLLRSQSIISCVG